MRLNSVTFHTGSSPSGTVFWPTFGAEPFTLDDDGLRRLETILAAERRRRIIDCLLFGRDLRASDCAYDGKNGQALFHHPLLLSTRQYNCATDGLLATGFGLGCAAENGT